MRRLILAALILCASITIAPAGEASCYGRESGPRTASGERFDPRATTAAMCSPQGCNTPRTSWVPFGTLVHVTYAGRSVVVRITDRGPFVKGRVIDLSTAACVRIGLDGPGHAPVELVIGVPPPFVPRNNDLFRGF